MPVGDALGASVDSQLLLGSLGIVVSLLFPSLASPVSSAVRLSVAERDV